MRLSEAVSIFTQMNFFFSYFIFHVSIAITLNCLSQIIGRDTEIPIIKDLKPSWIYIYR